MYDINVLIKDFDIERYFRICINKILKNEKVKKDQISIVVIDDVLMKKLNTKYRKNRKTTDVLSFVSSDTKEKFPKENYLGEIFISYEQAKRQSEDIKKEMIHLFVHGYLHIKGYAHDDDKQLARMNKAQDKILNKIYN